MNIIRVKKRKGKDFFYYSKNNTRIIDKDTIERINKLHIPPNWTNVEISESNLSHLQATGKDDKGRTQYIYHPVWVMLAKTEKYSRLGLFVKKLPSLTRKINKNLSGKIMLNNKEYVISLMFRILYKTHSRVGNDCYADENKTYGLTTLLKKHLKIKNETIYFSFIGKKGVKQNLSFKDRTVSNILKELCKIPGNRLFKTTNKEYIRSTDMNTYLKKTIGGDFTCKDFRTYASNILFLKYLCKKELPKTKTKLKQNLKETYDEVAQKLGHTRAISKQSYVIPLIEEKYMENPKPFVNGKPDKLMNMVLKDY